MDYNSVKQKLETIIDKLDDISITSLTLDLLRIKLEFIEKLIAEKKMRLNK